MSDKIRLSGTIPLEMILEAEIKQEGRDPDKFERMLKELKSNREQTRRLTDVAIKNKNLSAIEGFARVNRVVVAEALQNDEAVKLLDRRETNEKTSAPEIYFLIRNELSPLYKKIYRRLARSSILKLSLRIAAKWIRGEDPKKVQYEPGLEFDLDETLENYIEKQKG